MDGKIMDGLQILWSVLLNEFCGVTCESNSPSCHHLLIPFYPLFRVRPRQRVGERRLSDPWLVQERPRAIAASEAAKLPARKFSANWASAILAPADLQALV